MIVTVLWLASAGDSPAETHALRSWSLAHGVELAPPRDEGPRGLAVDYHLAADVEALLDRAHDAIAARDADGTDSALSAAESALRAHPELPQAAWLMAEVERTRSTRWRRIAPVDAEAAERAWLRAEALDGGRTAGLAEEAAEGHAAAATVTVESVPDGAVAWLDGVSLTDVSGIPTLAGPHVLAVTLASPRFRPGSGEAGDLPSGGAPGEVLLARWIDVPAGPSRVAVPVSGTMPCSSSDLARASLGGEGISAAGVRCEQWIAVTSSATPGAIRVARCGRGGCGPLLEWSPLPAWSWSPPPARPADGWPSWATWGIVGAGAAIVAGAIVVASGALQPASTETRFVIGAFKSQ
jgi:hypothetical protein